MKKSYFRSILMAVLITASASVWSQFPEWSYANIGTDSVIWNGVSWGLMDAEWKEKPVPDGKLTLELVYYPSFDMESQDVSDVWDMISVAPSSLDKYILDSDSDNPEKRMPDNTEDFMGEIKGIYDDENVYILVKVTDNEIIPGQEAIELMWASYKDTLSVERWPAVPKATTSDNEHIIARWGEMGAGKALANLDFVDTIAISVEGGFYFAEDGEGNYTHTWTPPDWNSDLGMSVAQFKQTGNTTWEAIWKFNIEKTFDGLVAGEEGEEFSFDFKVIDRDTLTQSQRIEACFNSEVNEVWWSTYYAGHARFGAQNTSVSQRPVSSIGAYPNPASEIVYFTETLKSVEVYNPLGACILEAREINSLDVRNFERGIYFLNIRDYNNSSAVVKIVVQK